MSRRETWTTEEFGRSHTGSVETVLVDGTVPDPVYFDSGSGEGGRSVSQWSVYDGRSARVPRAAALRAVCSCGWVGPGHRLDWDAIAGQDLVEGGGEKADASERDWTGIPPRSRRRRLPFLRASACCWSAWRRRSTS
ncbi:hypothetical protein [Streptomyces sp. NPDC058613]|uniref:hypothetical protein n=1 Tax=unclassified Streptomyces TaxID=2593676 RepID=UPI003662A9BB